MSYTRFCSSTLILLFTLVFSFQLHGAEIENKIKCRKEWGNLTLIDQICSVTLDKSGAPASFTLLGFRWNSVREVLSLNIKLTNAKSLSGLKLSFLAKGSLKATYELPLYTDPEYNLLQEGLETELSIPRSQLKWVESFEGTFDSVSVFISSSPGESIKLDLNQYSTVPRHDEGRISITFDDGYSSNFTAAEIMQPFNYREPPS
jgi:hypothetical protein